MLPERARRKADIVFSSFMIVLGLVMLYAASQMPWSSARTGGGSQWYLSPGLYPAILGTLLVIFSARVLVAAWKEVGGTDISAMFTGWVRGLPQNRGVQNVVFMMVLVGVYIFFGIGSADFRVVSAIFLFLFIAAFWWPDSGKKLPMRIAATAAIAAAVPTLMAYIFTTHLFVPMP
ncbi:MAG: tripartite tricarboxylate transporter TctB family protein [Rhizobiaceae bacterium]|nr:tripartite tricarboxylate transporter TctB family protein [Rhizobiaceae bacterium]